MWEDRILEYLPASYRHTIGIPLNSGPSVNSASCTLSIALPRQATLKTASLIGLSTRQSDEKLAGLTSFPSKYDSYSLEAGSETRIKVPAAERVDRTSCSGCSRCAQGHTLVEHIIDTGVELDGIAVRIPSYVKVQT